MTPIPPSPKLLEVTGNEIERRATPWLSSFPPIERAILERCAHPATATAMLSDARVIAACQSYRTHLEDLRLLPGAAAKARRWSWFAIAAAILLGVGAVKIAIALGRGRTNLELLVIFMVVASMLLGRIALRRRTALAMPCLPISLACSVRYAAAPHRSPGGR